MADDLPWPELGNVSRGATRGNQGSKGVLGPPDATGRAILQLRVQPGVLAVKLNPLATEWYRLLDGEVQRALKETKTYWRKARRRQDYDARADQDHMELHEWLQQLKDKTMAHLELLLQKGEITGPPYVMPDHLELSFMRGFVERQRTGVPHNPRLRGLQSDPQHHIAPEDLIEDDLDARGSPESIAPSPLKSPVSAITSTARPSASTPASSSSPNWPTSHPTIFSHRIENSHQALRQARARLKIARTASQNAYTKYTQCIEQERMAETDVVHSEERLDELRMLPESPSHILSLTSIVCFPTVNHLVHETATSPPSSLTSMNSTAVHNEYDPDALAVSNLAHDQGHSQPPSHVSHQNALLHQHPSLQVQRSPQHPPPPHQQHEQSQREGQPHPQAYPYVGYESWAAESSAPRPGSSVSGASSAGGAGGRLDTVDLGQPQPGGVQYEPDMSMEGGSGGHGGHDGQEEWGTSMESEMVREVGPVVYYLLGYDVARMLQGASLGSSPKRKHSRDWEPAQQQDQMSMRRDNNGNSIIHPPRKRLNQTGAGTGPLPSVSITLPINSHLHPHHQQPHSQHPQHTHTYQSPGASGDSSSHQTWHGFASGAAIDPGS
ncbi:hypothetical protein M0805_001555 [Coniferiporia weirii]|nr:hypothetical protein M0805_001555 [Coniferiporia weirii]